jgi:signal transduction histidine kinase
MLLNAFHIEFEGQYKDRILIAIEDITEKREQDLRKDDFLTIASHELRTPLTTIKGLSQILVRLSSEYKDPTYISTLDKITTYIERLNGLIATLLDTSKIQSGNIELHMEPLEIDKTIQDAIENMRSAVPESNIQYSGFTDCMVIGDELQVIQVVNNLLSNAIKYSPNSKNVEVNIDKVANFVKICVRDYGIGINYEDKLKIFERFFRVRGIQKKFPGLGIGLYISHQIIINHGGTLWVESELGEGSTFSFTLPILNNNE